jgi:hypothetical protein
MRDYPFISQRNVRISNFAKVQWGEGMATWNEQDFNFLSQMECLILLELLEKRGAKKKKYKYSIPT